MTTFLELQDIVLDLMEQEDTITRTRVQQYLNMVGRDVWHRYAWAERRKSYFFVAPASVRDDKAVDVTEGSPIVTGTGTQWQLDGVLAGWKFSRGFGTPWYTILSVDSDTQLTLEEDYVEPTATAVDSFVYNDIITLPADQEVLINIMSGDTDRGGVLAPIARVDLDALVYLPRTTGVPTQYAMEEQDAQGQQRVRMWPVPDRDYRMQATYLNKWIELVDDADVPQLEEDKRDLLVLGALKWGYLQAFESGKAQLIEARYERDLARTWGIDNRRHPERLTLRKFDDWSHWRNPLQLPFRDSVP